MNKLVRLMIAAAACLGATIPANAQLTFADVYYHQTPPSQPIYVPERLARAAPDECFDGIGVNYPPLNPDGTCDVGQPKFNENYVWGLTQAGIGVAGFVGDEIWFGTLANALCIPRGLQLQPSPVLTFSWVCEFGQSQLARELRLLPEALGDWRTPRAFSYNLTTRTLTERTPLNPTFYSNTGIRSAGSVGSTVIMAGPSLLGGSGFFAWDAASGEFLGACRAQKINNIRNWVTINGELYGGIGTTDGSGGVIRWVGTVDDPFNGSLPISDYCGFEIAAELRGFAAYLTAFGDDRIAVSAWTGTKSLDATGGFAWGLNGAGVFVSPGFGSDGILDLDDGNWTRVWTPRDYEPDPLVALGTAGGAIASWRGYLWFGSFEPGGTAALIHSSPLCTFAICYGQPSNQEEEIALNFNLHRPVSIWRARPGEGDEWEVELVYGETALPALIPGTKEFEIRPTGWTPMHGASGFDNPFLTYTWTAQASADHLLFGTYDYRYVFDVNAGILTADGLVDPSPPLPPAVSGPARGYGADLWRFDDENSPAVPEAVGGFEHPFAYGVRSLLYLDNGVDIILGTANGTNLEAEGGWELYQLTPAVPPL